MGKHTPEPWIESGWSIDGADGTCICEGFQDEEYDAPNRARIVACVNAFHSPDGRELQTEKIEPGLFWMMHSFLNCLANIGPDTSIAVRARTLLSKLETER